MSLKFSKALFQIDELLEVISVAPTTVDRWKVELKKAKRDLRDMGCYQLKDCKYDLYDPLQFVHYIKTERLHVRPGRPQKKMYDYEKVEQDQLSRAILVVENNQERKSI